MLAKMVSLVYVPKKMSWLSVLSIGEYFPYDVDTMANRRVLSDYGTSFGLEAIGLRS